MGIRRSMASEIKEIEMIEEINRKNKDSRRKMENNGSTREGEFREEIGKIEDMIGGW